MSYRTASACVFALLSAVPAAAADLPEIKSTASNVVPACATPGRLMAFVKTRNPKLDNAFDGIATAYMRHGESLGIRWDIAFFQMLVETGNLTFKGDVKPHQNNFAGLGATGGGERGESFKDVSTGARAHLEHVLMYAGERLQNPTAERTRKVQEWGVLTSWQKTIKGPMTFTHLTKKWSPHDRGYSSDIQSVTSSFMSSECAKPDPRPELVEAARGGGATAAARANNGEKSSGREIAARNIAAERATSNGERNALGGAGLAAKAQPTAPEVKLLNAAPDTETKTSIEPIAMTPPPAPPAAGKDKAAKSKEAKSKDTGAKDTGVKDTGVKDTGVKDAGGIAVAAAPQATVPTTAAAATTKCRVWQASYGGAKAVIIKAAAGSETNFTVLDVNEGAEKREAEAYISAYAKGGQTVGEFQTSSQALDKAFELCPEG